MDDRFFLKGEADDLENFGASGRSLFAYGCVFCVRDIGNMVMDSSQEISGPKRSLFTPKIALKKREMSDDSAEI